MDTRKRGRAEFANGGFKKPKPEMDSLSSGIGSKSKPCTKFFSIAGCPFGENCHFLHHVPGGYNAVAQMMNLAPAPTPRPAGGPPPAHQNGHGSAPAAVKTKVCNKYKTAEGCKFGNKCNFAHGEWELGKPIMPSHDNPRATGPMPPGRFSARPEPPVPGPAASFGATATAKISVDASLAGAVIGKGGVNSKQICRQTGTKLSIRDHETNPNLRNIELEGTFEQIQQASAMVRELIVSIGSGGGSGGPGRAFGGGGGGAASTGGGGNFKTKLCENFGKGSCTFGDRCHFAHGAAELRKTG
ncbi:zinc finger CCCH domain-containing protein 14-like [Salvia miltiorrhiza]|uniref:zinc finger CCCH domain-containing protein 14-like n=1 Tax=Salvia miltiorrhiza TaxID=226208 RepID=UPI0025ABC908|nr:zinc finger CCCH domain-containing protein 14-like [Salvia miltiorrhiza]XP_057768832.1 zinc finger CCCH domain-containing protein 14-like [Salvia miltiorrhiza]